MSTVSERESGPREMSFRGFADKTLQRLRRRHSSSTESQRETVHSSIPGEELKRWARRQGRQPGTALASCENLCLEVLQYVDVHL